jgi:hypothetical protein
MDGDRCADARLPTTGCTVALTRGGLEFNAAAGDPAEEKGIACAVEGRAGYGVAGDIHLLTLERCARIVILPPRRFPDVLEALKQSGG